MAYGPVELLAIQFPGNKFSGEISMALTNLVDRGMVHIIDIVFVKKDGNGDVTIVEMSEMDEEEMNAFDPVVDEVSGMLSAEDIDAVAADLEPNSAVGLMLFENLWAAEFAQAVRNADGEVILNQRIPAAAIAAAEAALVED